MADPVTLAFITEVCLVLTERDVVFLSAPENVLSGNLQEGTDEQHPLW